LKFNQRFIAGTKEKRIKVWDLKTGHCIGTYRGHKATITALQFDNNYIISGDEAGVVNIWDRNTGHIWKSINAHRSRITSLQYSSRALITTSVDQTIKVFELPASLKFGVIDIPLAR